MQLYIIQLYIIQPVPVYNVHLLYIQPKLGGVVKIRLYYAQRKNVFERFHYYQV